MATELNILFVEDLPTDVELAKRTLTKEGIIFQARVVETEVDFLRELENDLPDIIICDYKMPQFSGMRALTLRLEKYPDVPFILLTSSINEEIAVECIKAGADDYVLKDNLLRLVPAIKSALDKRVIKLEKQEALKALYVSEERFRSLYENSTIGLYRITPDGKILLANPSLIKMLNYSSFEEIASRDLKKDGFAPTYERKVFIDEITKKGIIHGLESAWVNKNGEVVFLRESAVAVKDSEENILYFDGTVEDITERKINEEKIKESELKFRSIIEASPVPYALNDESQNITYLNPAFVKTFGFSLEDIPTLEDWWPKAYPDSEYRQWVATTWQERLDEAKKENIPFEPFEVNICCKDGAKRTAIVSAVPVGESLNQVHLVILYNITERKKAEEEVRKSELRFKQVAESMHEWIWEVDHNGVYTYVSPIIEELLGYKAEEIIGLKYFYDFFDPENKEEMKQGALTAFRHKENFKDFINVNIHKDGSRITLSTTGSPILDKDNNLVGYRGVDVDITQNLLAQKALKESELRYRTLFEKATDGIMYLSTDFKIVQVNESFAKMHGYSTEEMQKIKLQDLDTPGTIQRVSGLSNRIMTGDTLIFEVEHYHKDGHIIPFEVSASLISFGNEKIIQAFHRDITERKKSEQKIKENEEIFTQLMKHSPVYIFFKDDNMRPVRLSNNFQKMLNKPIVEILGKNMYELFPSDFAKAMVEDDKKILFKGEVVKVDEELNGRYYHTIKFPIHIEGKPRYLAGFTVDITDRMLIEEALHESNEFLERLFNYANAPIVVWNDQFIITRFNPSFEALIGKMAKEVIGKPIEVLFPPEKIESSMKLIRAAQAGENLENEELDILYSDGSVRVVLWNSASVPGLGEKSLATIAQGLDITERIKMEDALRKSKKEFQTYFDSNTIGLSVTGADRSWIEVNQKLCEMLGFTKAELIDYNWLQLTHPEDIPYNLKLFNQALDGEIDNYQLDKRFFRKDGSIIYIALSAVCLRNDDGSVHHFLSSYNDITHRKLAEEVILKSEEKLRALNARLETVKEEERINLSRELHDHLGQNLTGLKMEISYFSKKMKNQEAFDTQDFLLKTNDMMELIDGMINNVRKISAELRPNILDYLGLIPAIECQLEELKKRTEIEAVLKSNVVKIDLGVQINSSIFRIVQEAFTNIIRHAGATKVIVSIEELDNKIKLEILDNGKGINEKEILNIKSLGIIGMKERTLQFNGTLDFKNVPLGGTLLTLIIPKSGELND